MLEGVEGNAQNYPIIMQLRQAFTRSTRFQKTEDKVFALGVKICKLYGYEFCTEIVSLHTIM